MLLVTGGLGYIGSHFVVQALKSGYEIVVIDNLSNSHVKIKAHIENLTKKTFEFVQGNVQDEVLLESIFKKHKIDAVVHFAGLKAVAESVAQPLHYYRNNVYASLVLLETMQSYKVEKIIFSSSATVYGIPQYLPYDELHPTNPINPYGQTKLQVENMLHDMCHADDNFMAISLRYFNPIGAHPSGLIGENPKDIPNNLMPYIIKVANGELPYLQVFGNDYDTRDGTGERDYIYIMDLVEGHLAALNYQECRGFHVFNLGTGKGTTVFELVSAFEEANNTKIATKILPRREGDLAKFWANASFANHTLGWRAFAPLSFGCRINSQED